MKVNTEIANGIVISKDDFEYVRAVRKPNVNISIIQEFWFKGSVKDFRRLNQ